MSSILERLKKNCRIKEADVLSESSFYAEKDVTPTSVPMINVALSGSIDGGLTSGLTVLAGPSRHFKSNFSLLMAAAYLKKHSDAVLMFYDSEFGSPQSYFEGFGIDISRVLHIPIKNIEELKFDLVNQLETLESKDKVVIVIDSVGNLASKKELEDAMNEKSVADMTRAKSLKGLFRMVTPYLTLKNIPLIAVNHTYNSMEMYSKAVVSGGCLEEGTQIQLADGSNKAINEISVGEFVITRDGPRKVTHTWDPETLEDGQPDCYELSFEDGHKVVCSDTHPFLVKGEWVEAKDLEAGFDCDCIAKSGIRLLKLKTITKVGKKNVYDITVDGNHEYTLSNGVVTHNTGILYSCDTCWILGRQQDKDGTEIQGYHFVINVEKSRFVKEKSKIPITVSWKGGIEKWSGLLPVALEGGYVTKPKNGWYVATHPETKVEYSKAVREAQTMTKEFWESVFKNTNFAAYIKEKYTIGGGGNMVDETNDDTVYTQSIEQELQKID